jgi:cytochrome c peroxidase
MSTKRPTSSVPCAAAATRSTSTRLKRLLAAGAAALLVAWTPPQPPIADDNPQTEAKIELGRRLFYDVRLSGSGTVACASCHQQARGFSGDMAPSLVNVAFRPLFASGETLTRRLEDQLLMPLLGKHPVEMGGSEDAILAFLVGDADYSARFGVVFGGEISLATAAKAIAAFERTLASFESPWDRGALSEAAKRGEGLFFAERTQCFRCHQPPLFTDTYRTADLPFDEIAFHDIGLNAGRLRAPMLRNVAVTGPYMHDGRYATLADVIDHYARGGSRLPSVSSYVAGFEISEAEKRDLIAFLESLTDESFLSDPRLGDPFARAP